MKFLSDYMNDKQTAAFNECGAFFAFSNKQFNEKKREGANYVHLGAGLIAPKENAAKLTAALETIYKDAIKQDLADNGVKAIIHRELANHECQITFDYSEVVDKLADYGITENQIRGEWSEYYDYCVKNNYF